MYCRKCGTELEDGSAFCHGCGEKVDAAGAEVSGQGSDEATAPSVPVTIPSTAASSPTVSPDAEGAQAKNRQPIIIAIIAGVAVLIAAIIVGIVLFMQYAENERLHEPVPLRVNAIMGSVKPEDTSGVPIRITGKDLDGNAVDQQVLYTGPDQSIEVLRGSYIVTIVGSPVGKDGSVYTPDENEVQIDVEGPKEDRAPRVSSSSEGTGGTTSSSDGSSASEGSVDGSDDDAEEDASTEGDDDPTGEEASETDPDRTADDGSDDVSFDFSPIPPADITDQELADIRSWMEDFGLPAEEIDGYIDAATKLRQADLDRIAEEQRRKAEEEARARAEALRKAAFGTFPKNFAFLSGVGAWSTGMTIQPNGSFEGNHHDSDMGITGPGYPGGTVSIVDFAGSFSVIEQVDQTTFRLQLNELHATHPAETLIQDNRRLEYYDDSVHGLGPMTSSPVQGWTLYLPGTSTSKLNEEEINWLKLTKFHSGVPATLDFMVLSNGGEYTWYSN